MRNQQTAAQMTAAPFSSRLTKTASRVFSAFRAFPIFVESHLARELSIYRLKKAEGRMRRVALKTSAEYAAAKLRLSSARVRMTSLLQEVRDRHISRTEANFEIREIADKTAGFARKKANEFSLQAIQQAQEAFSAMAGKLGAALKTDK